MLSTEYQRPEYLQNYAELREAELPTIVFPDALNRNGTEAGASDQAIGYLSA